MENVTSNYEPTLLTNLFHEQEESLRHISNELHDNICHTLLLAIFRLQKANKSEFEPAIRDSIHLLKKTLVELSNLSKTLNGEMIQSIGLKSAIQNQIDHLNSVGTIKAFFTITGPDSHLNGNVELTLFRIIQEAISNVIKHARATTIRILLSFKEKHLLLRIQDNGKGFDPHQVNSECAGLKNMQHRIQLAQGTMKIQSIYKQGTLLEFTVSLQKPTL
jgi:two-component system, NarL family, sensor kinase